MGDIKIVVEKHADGYVAYPLGIQGVVVGEGDTFEEAMADVMSAIRFHIETFGTLGVENPKEKQVVPIVVSVLLSHEGIEIPAIGR